MFSIYQNSFSKLAAGALVALATVCTPAGAGDLPQNLGPVGPHEPILTTVGSERVIAFFLPGSGLCAVHAVMWDTSNANTDVSATRVRVSLEPGRIVHIDISAQDSLNLQCGKNAEKLAIVDNEEAVAPGIAIQQLGEPMKASTGGF